MNAINNNIKDIHDKIHTAKIKAGRKDDIQLLAVSKTVPADKINKAIDCGLHLFGENRVQEARDKFLERNKDIKLHLIGHLQKNKARYIPQLFDMVQSIDSIDIASALNKECIKQNKTMPILIQVNTSEELSKFGIKKTHVQKLIDFILTLSNIQINGFMTIGPFTDNEKQLRKSFNILYKIQEKMKQLYNEIELNILSMGMSNDFELAIQEGANLVRIGSLLFGKRT